MIPFAQPNLDGNERKYLLECVESGWISGVGGFVTRFENALAERVGVKHAIATANGTLSLEVILMALGVGAGDEVIVPALTFVSPAAAIRRVGAKPVFADIDPENWCIDPRSVEKCFTSKTKAIIAVDLLGNCAPMDTLMGLNYVPVIEDAAEAHGARRNSHLAGSMGIAASFSFHPNKTITMGEGGAILTDWDWLAQVARKIANHGMDYPYHHDIVGTNARANNMTCAVGLAQVENWDSHVDARNVIRKLYEKALADETGVKFQPCWSSTWVVPLMVNERDEVVAELKRFGVDARPIFTPLCDLPVYAESAVLKDYPVARAVGYSTLLLPTHEFLTVGHIAYIARIIKDALA